MKLRFKWRNGIPSYSPTIPERLGYGRHSSPTTTGESNHVSMQPTNQGRN